MPLSELRDRRILVVEDEYLVAVSLCEALQDAGSQVIGPVTSVDTAIKAIEARPQIDAAVVDINLGGVKAYVVADLLVARSIPFIFTSGYEQDALTARYPSIRNCQKPYAMATVGAALSGALREARDGGG